MKLRIIIVFLFIVLAVSVPSISKSGDNKLGSIRLGNDLTVVVRQSITGTDNSVSLSPGQYNIDHWIISRTDSNDSLWTCEGYVPNDKSSFEVDAGNPIELPIGEPIISVLTATKRGTNVIFSHRIEGRLGEKIRIEKDGKQSPAPMLRIKNTDGSYDKTLSFAYG